MSTIAVPEIAERPIFPAPFAAVEHEHAGGRAIGKGLLRDPLGGEVVVEIRKVHMTIVIYSNSSPCSSTQTSGLYSIMPEASP